MFHLGDEILLERHGRVEDGKLIIGEQKYSWVIDSCCDILLPHTKKLLHDFVQGGGQMVRAEELPDNPVVDHPEITYTKRAFDDFRVHYFVNSSAEEKTATFGVNGKVIDIYSGETSTFAGQHTFEPWGSLMVLEETEAEKAAGSGQAKVTVGESCAEAAETVIRLSEKMRLAEKVTNCLTLDRCDYYFDGELQERNGYVLNICERANALGRGVQIRQDYHVEIRHVPEELYLVCETPEKFRITINGNVLDRKAVGYFADKSFQKIDIEDWVQVGRNTISFECDFLQSAAFYENWKRAHLYESERNKLVYDFEIEPIYLVGDFRVKTEGIWTVLDKDAVRYHGSFALDAVQKEICTSHMEKQGYPFFCGEMVLEGELDITGENPVLQLKRRGVTAVKVEIGDKEKWMLTNDKLSLKEFGVTGKVNARFTLMNNLRNLLGPHHLEEGECLRVNPGKFYKEDCVWNESPEQGWNEDYCFVEMTL